MSVDIPLTEESEVLPKQSASSSKIQQVRKTLDEVMKRKKQLDEKNARATRLFCGHQKIRIYMDCNETRLVGNVSMDGPEIMRQSFFRMIHQDAFWEEIDRLEVTRIVQNKVGSYGVLSGDIAKGMADEHYLVIGKTSNQQICLVELHPDRYSFHFATYNPSTQAFMLAGGGYLGCTWLTKKT